MLIQAERNVIGTKKETKIRTCTMLACNYVLCIHVIIHTEYHYFDNIIYNISIMYEILIAFLNHAVFSI